MCGATSAQSTIQQEQMQQFQQDMTEQMQTYTEDQGILTEMQGVYGPILAAGPNQKGFSQQEEDDLNSQAVTGTAQNYSQAAKAVGDQLASEGGGNLYVPSGGADQLKEEVAESSAQEESSQEQQIQQADYQQGYNEWQAAGAGLDEAAGMLNPIGYSGAATSAGNAASSTANQIAQEDNSWENAAIGAVGSVGSAAIDAIPTGSA